MQKSALPAVPDPEPIDLDALVSAPVVLTKPARVIEGRLRVVADTDCPTCGRSAVQHTNPHGGRRWTCEELDGIRDRVAWDALPARCRFATRLRRILVWSR